MADRIFYTVLYTSGGIHNVAKGPVAAVSVAAAGGAGYAAHYFEGHGLVAPDYDAVRLCLPHYWRRAWDRRKAAWFPGGMGGAETTSPASVSLIGRRGKPLATIYLQPYRRGVA